MGAINLIVTALCIVLLLATPSFSKHNGRGGTRSGQHRSSSGHRSRSGHRSNEHMPRICGYLRRVECNELSNPTNGTVAYMERGFEDIATYSCSDGFDLVGCSTRTCLSNGTWSGAPPTCDFRVVCPALTAPVHGSVDASAPQPVGTAANYTCDYGLVVGNLQVYCLVGGVWSGSPPTCAPACPSLLAPTYGNLSITGLGLGGTATATCFTGYQLTGSSVRNCTLSGWDGTAADCLPVTCPALPNPADGYVSTPNGTEFEDEAVYTCCDTGLELNGISPRSCLSTGDWSGTEPTCVQIDQCRDDGWFKAYQHDRDGVTISGSKENLRNLVESGAEVRVLQTDYRGATFFLTNIQNISPVDGPGNDICAQALMGITKDGLYSFQDGAGSWEFSNLCTTGDWHTSRWSVGEHTFINETRENVGLTWFVRTRWRAQSIFSTSSWNPDAYNCLLRSIRSGHSFRIVYRNTENAGYSFPVDNVEIAADESVVGAMALWHIGQQMVTSPDRYEFQDDAFWQFALHSSDRNRHTSSWDFGDHFKASDVNDTVDLEWHSDPCWAAVYSHDQDGNQADGSLSDLVTALEAGHRVRLLYDDHTSIEADEIMIRNGHVCAQLINHLSKQDTAHFTSDVHWYWQICCTTGTCAVARINVGSSTTVPGPTPIKRTIKWFVDTRTWENVLDIHSDGTVLSGDKDLLADAITQGADVRNIMNLESLRPGQGYSLIYTADNLEIDPNTNDSIAFHLRAMARNPSGSYEERFVTPLRWIFVLADTLGNVPVDFWKVGEHTQYSRGTIAHFPIKWFVNH